MSLSRYEEQDDSDRSKGKRRVSSYSKDPNENAISDGEHDDLIGYADDNDRIGRFRRADYRPRTEYVSQARNVPVTSASVQSSDNRRFSVVTDERPSRRAPAGVIRRAIEGYQAQPQPSNDLVSDFANIGFDDFSRCEKFAATHPAVFRLSYETFVQIAQSAFKDGKRGYAERCLNRALILSFWRQLKTDDEKLQYLSDLAKKHPKHYKQFKDQYDIVKAEKLPETRITTQPTGHHEPIMHTRPISVAALTEDLRNTTLGEVPGAIHGTSSSTQRMDSPYATNNQMKVKRDSQSQQYPLAAVPGFRPRSDSKHDSAEGPSNTRRMSSSSRLTSYNRASSVKVSKSSLSTNYFVQRNPNDFFKAGRVFKILWHEPAGANVDGEVNEANHYNGKYGEKVYSKICWMMVVKPKKGYCICCPISTYGGEALCRKNFSALDINAHAIVFAEGGHPVTYNGEPVMKKKPIPVEMDNDEQFIEEASRIHFGKLLTVGHNLKVEGVGMVPAKHIDRVSRYVEQEFRAVQ